MKVNIECVFEYDELLLTTRESLLQKEVDIVREIYQPDHLVEDFKERLAKIGFMNAEVWYAYNNGQGDGAVFDADIDAKMLCAHLGIGYNPSWEGCFSIKIRGRYNDKHSRETLAYCAGEDFISCDGKKSEAPKIIALKEIEKLRLDLCDDFFMNLKADLDGEVCEEKLLENLRSRRYVYRFFLEKTLNKSGDYEGVQVI